MAVLVGRDLFINGETLVQVKGPSNSQIPVLTELGLADAPISATFNFKHNDVNVDAWGNSIPVDVQWMLADVTISMNLVHLDRTVLSVCQQLAMGGANTVGSTGRAGQRMGNNLARFAPGNFYIGLNLSSPVAALPFRFWYTYLVGPGLSAPFGTERSIFRLTWRAIPYTNDPWGGGSAQPNTVAGTGALNAIIWDNVLDT